MSNRERRFPLDVLAIGDHFNSPGGKTRALLKHLEQCPSVRSLGAVPFKDAIMDLITAGKVNTIFIDLLSPGFLGGADSEQFISSIRNDFPRIVFVLYTTPDYFDEFCRSYPRFEHYFYLDYLSFRDEDSEASFKRLDEVLQKCEEWHNAQFQYDIALSFAGEDREYAEQLAQLLRTKGVTVFYDRDETANLLGKDLHTHLFEIYAYRSRYCVLFVSKAYTKKMWTGHERAAAQQRALNERGSDYIIPIRVDNISIPGLSKNIAYARIDEGIPRIANLLVQKLWSKEKDTPKRRIDSEYYWSS